MSEGFTIKTNNIPRELVSWFDMPADEAQEWFSYVDEDERYSPRFVQYRGSWYDVNDFESTRSLGTPHPFKVWDGYQSESFFSGILVRYVDSQCESVIVARYYN